ncbi:MAG: hypothetical protein WC516_09035 [Patescibacteria group bacterium]|jgi:hypothetical protein
MDPVVPYRKMPKTGDIIFFSEMTRKRLSKDMAEELGKGGITVVLEWNISTYSGFIYNIVISCGTARQEFSIKEDGTPGWYSCLYETWHVFYWPDENKKIVAKKLMTQDKLKAFNTTQQAIKCAYCGAVLKDPGLGPMYKHCPICEP